MLTKNNSLKEKCTGCFACVNICPNKAIRMVLDKEGFFYPKIDKEKCNNCNLCLKVCPVINKRKSGKFIPKKIFACRSRNKDTQLSSSSGGIFAELAKEFIRDGGVVFGVTFENRTAAHIAIDKVKDLDKIKGSKYLQSYVNESYKQVEQLLRENKKVLFSGTPCQIAGLLSFLSLKKIDTKNLHTIDLVCHGVPSYNIFKAHILDVTSSDYESLKNVKFREKSSGWKFYSLLYEFENKFGKTETKLIENKKDLFMRGYVRNYFLRKSCYKCQFRDFPRQGDITLGDFWGIKKRYYDYYGVSLVLVNSKKGRAFFNKTRKSIFCKPLKLKKEDLHDGNVNKTHKQKRNAFFKDYFEKGYDYCKRKYLRVSFKELFTNYLSKLKHNFLRWKNL